MYPLLLIVGLFMMWSLSMQAVVVAVFKLVMKVLMFSVPILFGNLMIIHVGGFQIVAVLVLLVKLIRHTFQVVHMRLVEH